MSDVILQETRESVRRITLNRPGKLNAMNPELVEDLIAALTAADEDDAVAVIVLAGAGRAFSAGADISRSGGPPPDGRQVVAASDRTLRLYRTLLGSSTPIIAEVHGYALGGGCNVAVSCDMVVAAENAVFGYPEVKVGLAASAVAPALVHRIPHKAAFELLTLCENVPAERALALGMINRVVPDDELTERTMAIADTLAGFDRDALRVTKRTIARAAELPLDAALEMACDAGFTMKVLEG